MGAVRAIGHPAKADEQPTPAAGPDELDRMMAEHGVRTVGPPMEADEAAGWIRRLADAAP